MLVFTQKNSNNSMLFLKINDTLEGGVLKLSDVKNVNITLRSPTLKLASYPLFTEHVSGININSPLVESPEKFSP